jgi:hypothetical protein
MRHTGQYFSLHAYDSCSLSNGLLLRLTTLNITSYERNCTKDAKATHNITPTRHEVTRRTKGYKMHFTSIHLVS